MKHKTHLRDLLVQRGLAADVNEAERLVLAALVRVEGEPAPHAGALVADEAEITLREGSPFVSRGGLKLQGALDDFGFDPTGLNCVDAGASSGGFTDCLLQAGAARVTAVDVGYGQFDWKLRKDKRVTLFERTNIAKADAQDLGAPFDVLVADLSFTSLARLAPALAQLVREQGDALVLVKPQFELPKDAVQNGVVYRSEAHIQALQKVQHAFEEQELMPQAMSVSHLRGPKGNIEFWIWATKQGATATIDVERVVCQAHEGL